MRSWCPEEAVLSPVLPSPFFFLMETSPTDDLKHPYFWRAIWLIFFHGSSPYWYTFILEIVTTFTLTTSLPPCSKLIHAALKTWRHFDMGESTKQSNLLQRALKNLAIWCRMEVFVKQQKLLLFMCIKQSPLDDLMYSPCLAWTHGCKSLLGKPLGNARVIFARVQGSIFWRSV